MNPTDKELKARIRHCKMNTREECDELMKWKARLQGRAEVRSEMIGKIEKLIKKHQITKRDKLGRIQMRYIKLKHINEVLELLKEKGDDKK